MFSFFSLDLLKKLANLKTRKGPATPSAFGFVAQQPSWFALVNSNVVATPDAFFTMFCGIAKTQPGMATRSMWPGLKPVFGFLSEFSVSAQNLAQVELPKTIFQIYICHQIIDSHKPETTVTQIPIEHQCVFPVALTRLLHIPFVIVP